MVDKNLFLLEIKVAHKHGIVLQQLFALLIQSRRKPFWLSIAFDTIVNWDIIFLPFNIKFF